ncbi:hypothetical protein SISNIDRAFT_462651 [Sistotremastrum niveocremeum HHB9708]|uniref:Uncharacterized protein n=1 Tax=Sistotremastrum niveocremeum HHB9708 TaxID=1314777 RepID=A0A164ZD40_9AGAM|nr:hypothetical protein SISNIDRAFT_462651 [Sistotremastrum niveocremeum HHB9708]
MTDLTLKRKAPTSASSSDDEGATEQTIRGSSVAVDDAEGAGANQEDPPSYVNDTPEEIDRPATPIYPPKYREVLSVFRDDFLYPGDPDFMLNVSWHDAGFKKILVDKKASDHKRMVVAELNAVGEISPTDCFLRPDGLFTGGAGYTKDGVAFERPLSGCKGNFVLVQPTEPPFDVEWNPVHTNLMRVVQNAPRNTKNTFETCVRNLGKSLYFRHNWFEELNVADPYFKPNTEVYDIFNWPTPTAVAADHIIPLRETHRTRPLRAWDIEGQPIPPEDYVRKLPGAMVRITFTLVRNAFRGRDVFSFDIVEMEVLREPVALVSSPSKLFNPGHTTPSRSRSAMAH